MRFYQRNILLITLFTFGISTIKSQEQKHDIFPLSVGNSWTLSYSRFNQNIENGRGTYDDGKMQLNVIGKNEFTDSIVWNFSETKKFRRRIYGQYHILISDTTLEVLSNPNITEWKTADHKILIEKLWYLDISNIYYVDGVYVNRYSVVDSSSKVAYSWTGGLTVILSANQGISEINITTSYGNYGLQSSLDSNKILSVKSMEVRDFSSIVDLKQNYPNPFTPQTTIQFSIFKAGFVNLQIFDLLGKEVASIISGYLQPGPYTVIWNSNNVPSGVYYYKITNDNTSKIKKLIVLK